MIDELLGKLNDRLREDKVINFKLRIAVEILNIPDENAKMNRMLDIIEDVKLTRLWNSGTAGKTDYLKDIIEKRFNTVLENEVKSYVDSFKEHITYIRENLEEYKNLPSLTDLLDTDYKRSELIDKFKNDPKKAILLNHLLEINEGDNDLSRFITYTLSELIVKTRHNAEVEDLYQNVNRKTLNLELAKDIFVKASTESEICNTIIDSKFITRTTCFDGRIHDSEIREMSNVKVGTEYKLVNELLFSVYSKIDMVYKAEEERDKLLVVINRLNFDSLVKLTEDYLNALVNSIKSKDEVLSINLLLGSHLVICTIESILKTIKNSMSNRLRMKDKEEESLSNAFETYTYINSNIK